MHSTQHLLASGALNDRFSERSPYVECMHGMSIRNSASRSKVSEAVLAVAIYMD